MKKQDLKNFNLPDSPGVYFFKDKYENILYIGKATSLKDRVRSYFNPDLIKSRGLRLVSMLTISSSVTYQKTDSVLEALLLESVLIKKYKPSYNIKEKDNKSFCCVVITKEKFPRVLLMRIRDFEKKFTKKGVLVVYGPFTSLNQLKNVMKIIRKMFPYRDICDEGSLKPCFNAQIHLCPGVCLSAITEKEYKENIKNIIYLFEGKKQQIRKKLEKEMILFAKNLNFEKAVKIRNTLFALNHIQDVNLIKEEEVVSFKQSSFRIEAYDVAHISGSSRVGVMVVIEGKEFCKNEYRKFKLEENINDDYEGLKQILLRRFSHPDWRYPDLIVVDGGKAHREIALKTIASLNLLIPCVSVVKDDRHKPKDILGDKIYVDYHKKEILLANNEVHRFAINYHKLLRNKRL